MSIHGFFFNLGEEERLRKTETIHNVNKMIQCAVENSVQFLSSQSNSLDYRQSTCMQLRLQKKRVIIEYSLPP